MWAKIFPSKPKSPEDVVRALRDSLEEGRGQTDAKAVKKMHEEVSKAVSSLKVMLFGDPSNDIEVKQQDVNDLVRLACEGELLILIAKNLSLMEFETRKDAVQIFNNLLRREVETSSSGCAVAKVAENDGAVMKTLVSGYDDGDIALNCGAILRECIRHEALAKLMLDSGLLWRFFALVEVSDFDVASDAFTTFKECLTRHVAISARFIEANMDRFVQDYNALLRSANYVTRRQSLKLLGEMLLERANYRIMTHYIASPANLRVVMNLLLDNRRNIQFEAFHVFKIFVANPTKPVEVENILVRNKERMLAYLTDFLSDREDEQFQEDRGLVLQEIRSLQETPENNNSS
ncbi:Calcium-binding protein 39-like [Gracilariopsis chorda]|uniref:Calcium-binding protein 39-like n=1 Tax=Gracilariopsis chorda TaxID=448386 RepID=A0A2V3IIF0_9FLOR|nr:Calcium-binding protein 39-like [Gracilariopsis chorda]|eukprot:PXF41818.1 Calcium-binding protein 39-like [Gracilariopsis chorda]